MTCVTIFMIMYTIRGEMEPTCHTSQAHSQYQERPTLQVQQAWQVRPVVQVRPALPGSAAPAPCHVLGTKHILPRVHNSNEQD
jgi:hypothetical protein